jgi:copper chaperone
MRTTVHIQNLKFEGYGNIIVNRLSELQNISEVSVNHEEQSVAFDFHTKHDFESAKHLLSRIGYPIVGTENKLKTKAQSYVSYAIDKVKKK